MNKYVPIKKDREATKKAIESSNLTLKAMGLLLLVGFVFAGVAHITERAVNWGANHELIVDLWPVNISTNKIIEVKDREPLTVLSPVVSTLIEEDISTVFDSMSEVDKYLYEKFGPEEFKVVSAIQDCENGSENPELLVDEPNGTKSVGVMMINSVHWGQDYCGGLHELTTIKGNIDCAYNIWERNGSYNAWSVLGGSCFRGKL
jgi:hypothetical protein